MNVFAGVMMFVTVFFVLLAVMTSPLWVEAAWRVLQRWFTVLVAAIHQVIDRKPAETPELTRARRELREVQRWDHEAWSEHQAYDDDAIERMLMLGTLNHPASCLVCGPATISAGDNTTEQLLENVLSAMREVNEADKV